MQFKKAYQILNALLPCYLHWTIYPSTCKFRRQLTWKSQHYYQGGQEGVLNFLPPIPCITGPCPFFLAFLPQWGISGKSWWGCATRFSNSGSYFRQKLSLSTPVFSPKITYICLKSYQIRMLSCFLVHLELKWQIRLYTPVVPLQTIPGSRPKCAKYIPFLDWNGPITLPFEAVHTYMASKRE